MLGVIISSERVYSISIVWVFCAAQSSKARRDIVRLSMGAVALFVMEKRIDISLSPVVL